MSNKTSKLSDTEFYNEPEGVHDILIQLYQDESDHNWRQEILWKLSKNKT